MDHTMPIRTLRFLVRHRIAILLAACCTLLSVHVLRARPRLPLYNRVMQQDIDNLEIPGRNIILNDISMFLPDIWKDVSASYPARHQSLVAAYHARDFWGRQMTVIITLQESMSGWERTEIGDIYFTTWYAGEGRRLYRIDVQASSARSAVSKTLCRSLRCMLCSMKSAASGALH